MTTPTPQLNKLRQLVVLTIFLLVGAVMFALFWFGSRNDAPKAADAKVGDCLHQVGLTSAETVNCDDANADFKVVGRVEGQYQAQSTVGVTTACDQWPEATTTYWVGRPGERGSLLCLSTLPH
jgi:hypothetical protein